MIVRKCFIRLIGYGAPLPDMAVYRHHVPEIETLWKIGVSERQFDIQGTFPARHDVSQ